MSEHYTAFESTPGGLALTSAILLYGSETRRGGTHFDNGPAFASIHEVEQGDHGPVICAGSALTRNHLLQWTKALNRPTAAEILPANVLVSHPDVLAWWVPAKMRQSYFKLSQPPKGLKALAERTSLPLPYPAHLFVARRGGLGVYALPTSERPTADTALLYSPALNVFINGQLCWGSVPKPKGRGVASMPEYEAAVFDSWSTHPNPGQELTVTGKGGLVKLWDNLAARGAKRFPVARLKPFRPEKRADPITLGQLIAGMEKA